MSQVQVTDEIREYLMKPSFDNWQWDDSEMMVLIRQMYIDLGFVSTFNIEMGVLHRWLYEIYRHYNNVPFHNFKHCFMVTQMMYGLICLIGLQNIFEPIDLLILVTAAVCHDLDHPGYNNAYQKINFGASVFGGDGGKRCILATDMAKHSEILSNFKDIISTFDPKNKEHKTITREILMKVSDISNEARPMEVSTQWVDCLLEEFFSQLSLLILKASDVSNEARPMEVADMWVECLFEEYFHQLDLILIKTADISNEVRPMEVAEPWLECLLEEYFIQDDIIVPVKQALQYYTDMQNALEEEKKRQKTNNPKTSH
ncbi:hypothetical protein LSH36_188g08047 [Paralvinella palmiformis]|uniref:PDEase domain-containing protein n=1 Tax=Paralvinella palmiformis TaxID=53620 RepID=A0AAD9N797_9ANNE|nr:hypothetical protein LSH36_188g08047 [Paralvinella palmiformis]